MEAFGLRNLALPLIVLGLVALVLPRLTVPRATRSQARVAVGIAVAAGVMLLVSMALFAALTFAATGAASFALDPGGAALDLVRRAAPSAILWAPILAIVWLGLAQGVEKRRGEDIMRAGRDGPGQDRTGRNT